MAKRVRWVAAVAVLALGGWWLVSGSRPGVVPGIRAELDPAPFFDAAKDAQPVSQVVEANDKSATRKPNIVVILADDLGYGDTEPYGARAIRTPALDHLAKEGVRFTQFYSSASVCSPSRAGLLTGRYPVRTGVSYIIFASEISLEHRLSIALTRVGTRLGMSEFHDSFVSGLPDSEITIPEALKVAGYTTGMVGKWHLGDFSHDPKFLPTRHGFDFFEGIPHSNDEFPFAYWRGEEQLTPNVGLDQEHLSADLTRAAVKFIDTNKDKPFFLYVAPKDVHLPFFPSRNFKGKSAAGPFGDAAEELDWTVGEILAALQANGLRDNTLVLFTSDNGAWFDGSTHGLRGRKGMPFEGGQRVPLIASWPGKLPAGTQVDVPAMNIDIFPTLLAVAGVGLPSDRVIDGRDLWGAMSGAETAGVHDALLFFDDKVIDGVRSGPWKYYRYVSRFYWPVPYDNPATVPGQRAAAYTYTDPKSGQTINLASTFPMLYDLRTDPGEAYNVADRHPEEAARALGFMRSWEQDFFVNPRGWK
ncbi:MAG: sulfatase [Deltaproteobacteria bacterium]|nr:sulfatase [Deltaproteobacteria bacterium]